MTDTPYQPRDIRRIHGLSERRRLPRLGKIRLGIKQATGEPSEVPYFLCPPEVERVYEERPTALRIMIPLDDTTQVFPQAYKWYGRTGLKCKGNGQMAIRRWADVEPEIQAKIKDVHRANDLVEIPCNCPRMNTADCKPHAQFFVLLPDVSLSGVYELATTSFSNIIEINSTLDLLRSLLGRVAMIPLTLRRVPTYLMYEGKKRLHYLLKLTYDGDLASIQRIRDTQQMTTLPLLALPEPDNGPNHTPDADETPTTAPATHLAKTADTIDITPASSASASSPTPQAPNAPAPPQAGRQPSATKTATCACGATVTAAVAAYSTQRFGAVLCMPCQKTRLAPKRKTA